MALTKRTTKSTRSPKSNTAEVARITTQTVDMQHAIQERAYELYRQRGFQNGHDVEDWLTAEAEVLSHFGAKAA